MQINQMTSQMYVIAMNINKTWMTPYLHGSNKKGACNSDRHDCPICDMVFNKFSIF